MTDTQMPEAVYLEYKSRVERYVGSRVANRYDAADLVSEIFEKVLLAFAGYDEKRAGLSTWIYTITKNTVCDYFRRYGRAVPYGMMEQEEAGTGAAEDGLLREEELEILAAALERLPGRERDILVLRFYYEVPPSQIAEKMGISYANVRYLQSTALKKLRKMMGG